MGNDTDDSSSIWYHGRGANFRILNPQFYLEKIPIVISPLEVMGAAFFRGSIECDSFPITRPDCGETEATRGVGQALEDSCSVQKTFRSSPNWPNFQIISEEDSQTT